MSNTILIDTLTNKKMELEEELKSYQDKINILNSKLNSLNETIIMFEPNSKKRISYFKNNECQKLILNLLKKSTQPIQSSEIANQLQKIKNLQFITKKEKQNFDKNISNSLSLMRKKDLIETIGKVKRNYMWQIKPLIN